MIVISEGIESRDLEWQGCKLLSLWFSTYTKAEPFLAIKTAGMEFGEEFAALG